MWSWLVPASPRCGSCCQRKPEAERRFLMRRSPIGRRSDGAAVMLDVSRHFFDKEEIFTLLDQMARLKLNKFHWHLTDDQGWRIEIPCYPELTQEGAWRLFNGAGTRCAWARAAREQNDDFLLPGTGRLGGPTAPTRFTGDKLYTEGYPRGGGRPLRFGYRRDSRNRYARTLQAIDSYPWLAVSDAVRACCLLPRCAVGKDFRTLALPKRLGEELFELFPYEYVHMGGRRGR